MIRAWAGCLLAALCLVAPARAQEAAPPTAEPELAPSPSTPEPQTTSLPDYMARAVLIKNELRELQASAEPDPRIEAIGEELPALELDLENRVTAARLRIEESTRLQQLLEIESRWLRTRTDLDRQRRRLNDRSVVLHGQLERVDELTSEMEKVFADAEARGAPEEILARIAQSLQTSDGTRQRIDTRWGHVLRLEGAVSALLADVDEVMALARRNRESRRLFSGADAAPIWRARPELALREATGSVGEIVQADWREAISYVEQRPVPVVLHALFALVLMALLVAVGRSAEPRPGDSAGHRRGIRMLGHPFAAGLLLALLCSPFFYSAVPSSYLAAMLLLSLAAVFRLVPSLLERRAGPVLYALAIFTATDLLRETLEGAEFWARVVFQVELLVAIGFVVWLLRTGRVAVILTGWGWVAAVEWLLRLGAILLTLALGLNAAGFVEPSELIGEGVLRSTYFALAITAGYHVLKGVVLVALRSDVLGHLNLVRRYPKLLARRLIGGLRLLSLLQWVLFALTQFAIADNVGSALRSAFTSTIAIGEVETSAADLGVLALTVVTAIYLSRLIRFALEEEVFERMELPLGVPHAISVTAGYTILFLGFLLAFAAAGFDLNRFTILAGAFGVGVGFGLQTIVNNFVSGLILIFERPVRVGDRIEMGEVLGEVRRIGIRASTVRTFQGAEVIVPNARLISDEVTNWTLSDQRRRIELDIPVEYGSDPEKVIQLLEDVARSEPRLLTDPAPSAIFTGFGESELRFQLRVWTAQAADWILIRSDLGVAISRSLGDASIRIPFPQRDVHVRPAGA